MSTLFDQMVSFYERSSWPMAQVPHNTILSTTYQGENGQWIFVASVDDNTGVITMFSRAPLSCPPDLFNTMSEFLERANFGMTHGAWVMDRNDGEIRYRVGVDMEGMILTDEYLRNLTLYTNFTMDSYLPSLKAIVEAGASAKTAFEMMFPS